MRILLILSAILLLSACKLELTSGPNGKISAPALDYECDSECEYSPPSEFEADFIALPDTNYQFAGWSGDACNWAGFAQIASCPVIVNQAIADLGLSYRLEAHFTRKMAPGSAADTPEFKISNFGFGGFYTEEVPPLTCYPEPDICAYGDRASWIAPSTYATGDFNSDGYQDLVVQPYMNNKYISKQQKPGPVIFLNDKEGGLYRSDNLFANGKSEDMFFGYRMAVEDFNNDGVDDLIVGPFGILSREPDSYKEFFPERIPIYLSGPDNKLHDSSDLIEGQENGAILPNMSFAHDLATGDIDGDGDIDVFLAEKMLMNNGDGSFSIGTSLANRGNYFGFVASSLIDDFDGDGIGDLVILYGPGDADISSHIYLSEGRSSLIGRDRRNLPEGYFGDDNTNNNHAASGDLDGDGDADIVIGATRKTPYYVGRAIQVLINDGSGRFTDRTANLIGDQSYFTEGATVNQGEGFVTILDFNGDGKLDIFDRRGVFPRRNESQPITYGVGLWLNNGDGTFANVPGSIFPFVETRDLLPFDGTDNSFFSSLMDPSPIDLDGRRGLDIVTWVETTSYPAWDFGESTLYTLTSKKVLNPADYGEE